MPDEANRGELLSQTRDAMVIARRRALELADKIVKLEVAYEHWKAPLSSDDFYVPTLNIWGLVVEEEWKDPAPLTMHRIRREVIEAMITFRKAIDRVTESLAPIAPYMDGTSQSFDQKWTARMTKLLRRLRGCVLDGHSEDYASSALPMIRMGIPHSIRESVAILNDRIADVKSAISLPDMPSQPGKTSGNTLDLETQGVWIRSDDAAKRSGLDPNTIRTRAKREGWSVKKVGKFNVYLLENLLQTWPGRNFTSDERKPNPK